jgi:thiol:disulfide interchange protein DsbD
MFKNFEQRGQLFKQLVKKYNIRLLLADWTKRDPVIGKWLKAHGFAGVPAYFLITPQGKLITLGETISINKIRSYLK